MYVHIFATARPEREASAKLWKVGVQTKGIRTICNNSDQTLSRFVWQTSLFEYLPTPVCRMNFQPVARHVRMSIYSLQHFYFFNTPATALVC